MFITTLKRYLCTRKHVICKIINQVGSLDKDDNNNEDVKRAVKL